MADTIILGDKAYIPAKLVSKNKLTENYERHIYNEKACSKCDALPDRFSDICAVCPAHLGHFKTWKADEIKGSKYIGLPIGDKELIEKTTGIDLDDTDIKIDDRRADVKSKHPLNFTKQLYNGTEIVGGVKMANQKKIVKRFWKTPGKSGFIEAPPRTGKTAMATRLICAFKRRTLVLVHERELAKQFLRTLRNFTDLRQQEKETGRKIAGIIQEDSDWDGNWDIVLCTYQKFLHPETGQPRIRKHLQRKFGLVIIDEAHRANAEAYSQILNRLDCKYKLALSATPKRKDGLEFVTHQIVGPVVAKATTVSMIPRVAVHFTKIGPPRDYKGQAGYTLTTNWLSRSKQRNMLLIKQVFADLRENPKHSIVIPVLPVAHAKKLVKFINKQAEVNNKKKGENWAPQLARLLLGSGQQSSKEQDATLAAARAGDETRVVVATRKKVAEGIDVRPWTHLYLQIPMNNQPNFYQMTQRICTPMEDKPEPVLRIFVDDCGLSLGCFASTWFNGVIHYKYKVDDHTKELAYTLMKRTRAVGKMQKEEESLRNMW